MSIIKDIFMEQDKSKISFTRVTGFILVFFYILTSFYLLIKEHKLVDIPTNLFLLICGLYGINKIANVFVNNKQQSTNTNTNTNKSSSTTTVDDSGFFK
jgi:hypothetical protein